MTRFGGGFAGVFRVDDTQRAMRLHVGRSADGIEWEIASEPIGFVPEDGRVGEIQQTFEHAYDPRVTWLEDRYYVTWPSDGGHTAFGDVFCSESPDLVHWGRHRHVMAPVPLSWQATKVGAGPVPIETDEGWLVLYHGVLTSCNGFVYSMGAALLDLDEPWRVVGRGSEYLLAPQTLYERVGDVPNVVFPCAALVDGDRVTIYYGAADTVVCLAYGYLSELLAFVRRG